jgi:hypothetical protein
MSVPKRAFVLLLSLAGAGPAAAADPSLSVDHSALTCLVAGRHPRVAARFAPDGQVARARVYFRGGGQQRWYYVDMTSAADGFQGVLPKPTLRLETVEYYVDALGRSLGEARSPNHAPRVVAEEAACRSEALLVLADRARVVVGGEPGSPTVPDGFSADGVVAAPATRTAGTSRADDPPAKGGGPSGKTIGLGLAGLGAIGVAVAAGGGGDDPPASGPTAAPGGTSPTTSTPGGPTTLTFTANLFGPGWHRGDCSLPQDLNARFTPRASGRADLALTFQPRFEQHLSLGLLPETPAASGSPQGPGPSLTASYPVQAGTAYSVRICVPVGPPLDPGPFAVTLTVAHP